MKRLVLAVLLVAFAASCTPESTSEELENNGIKIQATSKDGTSSPGDKDGNGGG